MSDAATAHGPPADGALRLWLVGARPRTLGVGAIPVLIGAAVSPAPRLLPTLGALLVAVSIQVGANYANDYSDGVRGVDTAMRIGPPRLTASGLVPARAVLVAAAICLGIGAATGLSLTLATGTGWLALIAGGLALCAAALYTGGPRPYAAVGVVADLAVFAFFGLLATVGTVAVQGGGIPVAAWWVGAAIGLLAVAVLEANNLRDRDTDRSAGRHTLVVRLGDGPARLFFAALLLAGAIAVPVVGVAVGQLPVACLLILCALPALVLPLRLVNDRRRRGRDLVALLPLTARLHLTAGAMLALGLVVAPPHDLPLLAGLIPGLLLAAGLSASDLGARRPTHQPFRAP